MIYRFIPQPLKEILRRILNFKTHRTYNALYDNSLILKIRNENLTYFR